MGIAEFSTAALRIFGDDLVPEDVTALMGCAPDSACAKGDIRIGPRTGHRHVQKTGKWILRATQQEPEDLPAQIREIFGKLPQDHALWRSLGERYCIDLFCGVFMASTNDGLSFPADLLKLLSERGIALNLDVYAPIDENARSSVASISGASTPDE